MSLLTQENRMLSVSTPLGRDHLVLERFVGNEAISELFAYRLDMLSDQDSIEANKIVGKGINFSVVRDDGTQRFFHGYVNQFASKERASGYRRYSAQVVPWLWFLTLHADCRIFQELTVLEIIEKIFKNYPYAKYEVAAKGSHPKREYCVQYNESDFQFVSRLMEEEGLTYYFRHAETEHVLVIGDGSAAFKPCKQSSIQFEYSYGSRLMGPRVTDWQRRYEYVLGKVTQTDYNFEKPHAAVTPPSSILETSEMSVVRLDNNGSLEHFHYPGRYVQQSDGKVLTRLRMEQREACHDVTDGASTCCDFNVGNKFTFESHDVEQEVGKTYAIISIEHEAIEPTLYRMVRTADELKDLDPDWDYSNRFRCIPDKVAYRAPLRTPKPYVHGVQTAVVVGPKSEEIWPDKYGRVKVQFPWDREGQRDDKSSCWIRVAQPSAGKGWGAMSIPRVGQEVVVSFVDGDPDRPLITGCVYNADQMPPYPLPANRTMTVWKSNTSPGGDGFNEIRLQDLKDKEQIFIHAQRNMDVRVVNDSLETVGNDKHVTVGRHAHRSVGENDHLVVGGSQYCDVGGDVHGAVGGNATTSVRKNVATSIGGALVGMIAKSVVATIGQALQLTIGTKLTLLAGSKIMLVSSGGFISIGPDGITIQGTMVKINSGGAPETPETSTPETPTKPTKPQVADKSTTGSKSTHF